MAPTELLPMPSLSEDVPSMPSFFYLSCCLQPKPISLIACSHREEVGNSALVRLAFAVHDPLHSLADALLAEVLFLDEELHKTLLIW